MTEAHKSEKVELKFKIDKLKQEIEDIRKHKVSSLGTQRETIANIDAHAKVHSARLGEA